MDPVEQLKAMRRSIGCSVERFARVLGYSGPNAADNYRQLERGSRAISGPLLALLDQLEPGFDVPSLAGSIGQYLPAFVSLAPLGEVRDFDGVLHTRYPRFVAVFTELMPEALRARVLASDLPRIPAPPGMELGDMVALPLDPLDGDLGPLLQQAWDLRFVGA